MDVNASGVPTKNKIPFWYGSKQANVYGFKRDSRCGLNVGGITYVTYNLHTHEAQTALSENSSRQAVITKLQMTGSQYASNFFDSVMGLSN